MSLPKTASVVIVGAGCIGTSIAYHLARRGVPDVLVIEKEAIAGSGSTSRAAGGIRAQFSLPVNVTLSMMSIERYERFGEEMDDAPVFDPVGYLFVLSDPERWAAFQSQVRMQQELGLPVVTLTPEQIAARVPQIRVDDVLGGTFCEKDGLADPGSITLAYERQARRHGARFEFGCTARGLIVEQGRVRGVLTGAGAVSADWVVNAAGPHAAEIAAWAGIDVPVLPVRRHCFTTEPMPWIRPSLPMIVDMNSGVYMHRESGGMLLGLANREEPPGFDTSVNWDLLERVVEPAMHRVPALEEAEVSNAWAGLYETTPDHNAILGPPAAVSGFLLANGFSGHGLMHAPAVGQLIGEWIVDGRTSVDVRALALERFAGAEVRAEANVI